MTKTKQRPHTVATSAPAPAANGQFVVDNMRWVRSVALRTYSMVPVQRRHAVAFDDWYAEGLLHAVRRSESFTPERGRPTTFLAQMLNNHYINLAHKMRTQRRDDRCVVVSIGQPTEGEEQPVCDPGVEEDHTYNDALQKVAELMAALDPQTKSFLLTAMVSAETVLQLPRERREELTARVRDAARRLNITFEHVWRAATSD